MSIFTSGINEDNGRMGLIEIENKKIITPSYIPTKNEFASLSVTPKVEKKDYKNAKIGELVSWFNKEQLWKLEHKEGTYNSRKSSFKTDLASMDAPTKIIHYDFFDDVDNITIEQLELLLDLQFEAGADVIQVPNINKKYDYNRALEKAIAWKSGKGITKPLMGVIRKSSDLDLLKTRLSVIESIGVNLSSNNRPLLVGVKNKLKDKSVWIHGISAPVQYPRSSGTLGVLVNYYGIDTISTPVINWKSAQGFGGTIAKMADEEHLKNALKNKYFKPTDYETPTLEQLKVRHGEDHKLSAFCNCPVCRGASIKTILETPRLVNNNSRSHRVISFINESETYQQKIKNNETTEYLNSKPFAKEIIG